MTPLIGFAPDLEAPTVGVLTDCENLIPYKSGMEAGPSPVPPIGMSAIADPCTGAASVTKRDGTKRLFAGTDDALYEYAGGTWVNQSSATYSGGADSRWCFAQFGDTTIATNKANPMQQSSAGTFADVGTAAPLAEIVYSVGSQVMALNVDDGSDKPDGWHCCAVFDSSDWVPSIATQCARGQLVATSGPITAGLRLGEYATAYKARSIYLGQYVGAPAVWDWILVPGGNAGCVGKEAICDIDAAHFFVGQDQFWIFDGTRPVPVGTDQVRQWFFDNADQRYLYKTICVFERHQNRVWIFYPSAGSDTIDSTLVYHLKGKQWGRANRSIEAALNYASPGLTFDTWDQAGASFDALPDLSYDSPYWIAGGNSLAVFDTSHQLGMMIGDADPSSMSTGDAGDDDGMTTLRGIRPRFAAGREPTTSSVQTFHKRTSGGALEAGPTSSINDGKYDVMRTARWHRAVFQFTGNVRITGLKPDLAGAGKR